MVADRLQKVRFPESDPAIDEERVVRGPGVLRHLDRCGTSELVCLAGYETVEREIPV
jgi:hypothetical protein